MAGVSKAEVSGGEGHGGRGELRGCCAVAGERSIPRQASNDVTSAELVIPFGEEAGAGEFDSVASILW